MIHEWLQATDGNSASVRVFLFDYRKAFDFIDHGTLAAKLREVEVPTVSLTGSWTSCEIGPRGLNLAAPVCLNGVRYQRVSPRDQIGALAFFAYDQRTLNPQCALRDVEVRGRYHLIGKRTEGATK